eukprot:2015995-Rhodomonas_salina.4
MSNLETRREEQQNVGALNQETGDHTKYTLGQCTRHTGVQNSEQEEEALLQCWPMSSDVMWSRVRRGG